MNKVKLIAAILAAIVGCCQLVCAQPQQKFLELFPILMAPKESEEATFDAIRGELIRGIDEIEEFDAQNPFDNEAKQGFLNFLHGLKSICETDKQKCDQKRTELIEQMRDVDAEETPNLGKYLDGCFAKQAEVCGWSTAEEPSNALLEEFPIFLADEGPLAELEDIREDPIKGIDTIANYEVQV
jgi:hypothetical protein